MGKEFSEIIVVCTLIEGIITYFNNFFVGGTFHYQMLLSLAIGITIAVCYKLDILKILNITSEIPYIGNILTGVLFSRGSNYIYDLISSLS